MVSAKAVVSAAVPVGRSSVRNSTFGQRMYAVDRTPDIRLTSRCTPAAMPKVSVESSTRSTPSVPTVRRIRRTMLAFSVLGNTDACEMIRRISLPDMGFGMMPIALPSTTVTGSGRCELISLITHRYPGLEAPPFRAGRNARSAGLSDPAERLGGCPGSACTRRRRRRRRCSGTARRPGSAGTWRWSRPTPTAPPAARPPRTSPRSVGNWPRPGRSTSGWPPAARPSSRRPGAISTRPGATSTAAPTGGRPGARPAGTRASGSSADRPAGSAGSTVAGPRSECRSSAGSGSGSAGPSPYAKSYRVTRDSAGRSADDPNALVPAGLAPGRPPVGAAVEVAPGLVEIAQGLLLDGLAAGGQPGVLRPGLGQLPTLRGEVRGGLAAGGAVGVGLLPRQVPDEPGLRAVPEQRRLLRRRRGQAEPGHPPSLSAGSDNPADRAFLPALNGGASSPGYQ